MVSLKLAIPPTWLAARKGATQRFPVCVLNTCAPQSMVLEAAASASPGSLLPM